MHEVPSSVAKLVGAVTAAFLSLALALPEFGAAQTAAEGYGAVSGAQGSDPGGSLPFTGLEIGTLLLVGVALLATGLVLRRLAGSSHSG